MKLPQDLGARLASSYGLDPNLCQGPGLEHAVQHCREKLALPDNEAFFTHLRSSRDAFKAFAEELLIPESWFFRDRAPFLFLKQWVNDVWLKAHPDRPLKVLSLPCAAGQEPYSIAITLLEAGLDPERFSVLAGDLHPCLLDQAREGRYRAIAFRGGEFCDKDRYFEQDKDCHLRVREFVRQRVEFRLLNLIDPLCYAAASPFDVIFCRNVLIYFDEKGRKAAFRGLSQALTPDGLLCVGHADALGRITEDYQRVGPPGAFSYQRKPAEAPSSRPAPIKALPRKAKASWVASKPLPKYAPKKPSEKTEAKEQKPQAVSSIGQARTLADNGKLSEAQQLCREELTRSPGSVEALYLLAQILLAQKRIPDGDACLRRVVYLDPGHTDALFRLALLAEQRGDEREATNWRRRATKRQLETANP